MVRFSLPLLSTTTTVLAATLVTRSATPSYVTAFKATHSTPSLILATNRAFVTASRRSTSPPHPRVSSTTQLRMSTTPGEAKRVLVPIGDGSEEIETACITDTLTRFGASCVVASVKPGGELVCTMSRGIKFLADMTIDDAAKEEWDLIALPGGMPGAEHLRDSAPLIGLLEKQKEAKKKYAAVCASPAVVLASKGLLGEGATCYPNPPFRAALKSAVDDEVVVSDNVITSQGPGTSLKFALQLGEELYGKEKADEIAGQMLVTR